MDEPEGQLCWVGTRCWRHRRLRGYGKGWEWRWERLREGMRGKVPGYMVPSVVVEVERLPFLPWYSSRTLLPDNTIQIATGDEISFNE